MSIITWIVIVVLFEKSRISTIGTTQQFSFAGPVVGISGFLIYCSLNMKAVSVYLWLCFELALIGAIGLTIGTIVAFKLQ